MQDKKYIKYKVENREGYILIFTLIIMAIILFLSLSVSKIIEKEVFLSRLTENSRVAYFAADIGMECAQYVDDVLRDNTLGISLFLSSSTNPNIDFYYNAVNNVFFSTSSLSSFANSSNYRTKIFCASNGNYNSFFNAYTDSRSAVLSNLNNSNISSFYIQSNSTSATTTFGLIIDDTDSNGDNVKRCVLVDVAKNISGSFSVISTGYSSCKSSDPSKVSRAIYRYTTN